MNTPEEILARHLEVLELCKSEDYYLRVVDSALKKYPNIETPEEICCFWNDVWYGLPDTMAIRRKPFWEICNLAEGEYLDPETGTPDEDDDSTPSF
jgi:hypothetical protein